MYLKYYATRKQNTNICNIECPHTYTSQYTVWLLYLAIRQHFIQLNTTEVKVSLHLPCTPQALPSLFYFFSCSHHCFHTAQTACCLYLSTQLSNSMASAYENEISISTTTILLGLQYFSPKAVNLLNRFLSSSYPTILHNIAVFIDTIHTTQYC